MDFRQKRIFKTICEHNNIKGEHIIFKQFRNLKEFKFFKIERINPNHRIKLYGQPKGKHIKDGHYNKFINVGEILIYGLLYIFIDTNILIFWCSSLALTIFCLDLCLFNNPFEVFKFYVDWYRRQCWKWKNYSISEIS
jgi:hypothetical protein